MTVPPGTVLNKQTKRHTPVILRSIGKNSSKVQQPLHLANVKSGDSFKRPDSVSSQQTFVLENSRRRPLVARDPFKIAEKENEVIYMPKSKRKDVKVLIPEKPMANLTSAMREELYATPESFENATVQTSSSDTTDINYS
ncbi:hypothetical protein WUBG_05740 [Wuchereria bancrofti]|uniref:Uncharacterized protein n=1 Tax=Wuchereria bancrofti TaxID=6293 RepID=J9F7L1_WUCBA|nr:hypothetical protein WUBG_05740 [Wuchereria bancrofti]